MLKNVNLAKSISDISWNKFVVKLQYKSTWYGRKIVKVHRWFPSSQICSECGNTDGKKALYIRKWACKSCGVIHDRDINASKNILKEGLRALELN